MVEKAYYTTKPIDSEKDDISTDLIQSLRKIDLFETPHDPMFPSTEDNLHNLKFQLSELRSKLLEYVQREEYDIEICTQATRCETAKQLESNFIRSVFNQVNVGKGEVIDRLIRDGNLPTGKGMKHAILDLKRIRNEKTQSLLHVACDFCNVKGQKLQVVKILVEKVGMDPSVRDIFGRTPLHVAAVNGYIDIVEYLIQAGADFHAKDKAGMTAVSLINTLSKPSSHVVKLFARQLQKANAHSYNSNPLTLNPNVIQRKMDFLIRLAPYVHPSKQNLYKSQVNHLYGRVQTLFKEGPHAHCDLQQWNTIFAEEIQFLSPTGVLNLVIEELFTKSAFLDEDFHNHIRIQQVLLSLEEINNVNKGPSKLTWGNFIFILSKIIKDYKNKRAEDEIQAPARSVWHYAVLLKPLSQKVAVCRVEKGENVAIFKEDISSWFPLEDRVLIEKQEYIIQHYDPDICCAVLDRPFPQTIDNAVVYTAGYYNTALPPKIVAMKIWENCPSNRFLEENQEQELYQDFQFIDPDSPYEVTEKLGPVKSRKEARDLVVYWNKLARDVFNKRSCMNMSPSCQVLCVQKSGQMQCLHSMKQIGKEVALQKLGKATMCKEVPPRAAVQKLQNKYNGNQNWPGSPSRSPSLPVSLISVMDDPIEVEVAESQLQPHLSNQQHASSFLHTNTTKSHVKRSLDFSATQ